MWYRTPRGLAAVGGAAFLLGTIVGVATAGGDENDDGRPLPATTTSSTSTSTSTSTSSTSGVPSTTPPPSSSTSTSSAPRPGPSPTLPDITTTTLLGDP